MSTFDRIAEDLLREVGYEIEYCNSDTEAMVKADNWKTGMPYPVHFSGSDTSGEKGFEEFYVEGEKVDFHSFNALGVIREKPAPERVKVVALIEKLESAFESERCTKADIVNIIGEYLPNFRHIETGKNLDEKC